MAGKVFYYPILVKEIYLDTFGHMNNATYLTLFEEARWDILTKNGYGLQKIQETGLGPTILELKVTFLKETRLRDQITIETQLDSYKRKIAKLSQRMVRDEEICCTADFTIALFDLHARKLVLPTPEWLYAVGSEGAEKE